MPYIRQGERLDFKGILDSLPPITTKGQLEYCIFKLMKLYMKSRMYSYTNLHDATYAAQHCADEFRRRFLDNREDDAQALNGDID
jgi:hypothetical protein